MTKFLFDSYTRPIADLLVSSGKQVEESCLPAIGIADKCDFLHVLLNIHADDCRLGFTNTNKAAANFDLHRVPKGGEAQ